jgi:RNA polymerase sigma-70 factor (ECF subfamily)
MSDRPTDVGTDLAFGRFYAAHYPKVLAYCRRRVGPEAAEDASTEVFTAAWRKWSKVPKGEAALPWLYGAAHREMLHQWRSAARYRRLIDRMQRLGRPDPPGPDQVVVDGVEAELARQALTRLRQSDQEVLRLGLWEELTNTEIAAVLGLTENAVAMRFLRAKQRFGDQYRASERRHLKSPGRAGSGGGE